MPSRNVSSRRLSSRNRVSSSRGSIASSSAGSLDRSTFESQVSTLCSQRGYEIKRRLGAGAFGTVFKGCHLKTRKLCAVKVMNFGRMSEKLKLKFLPRELKCLIEARHDNVVQVWDIFRTDTQIFIFMEFAPNGDLNGYMKKNSVSPKQAATWFVQSCRGLFYLHDVLGTAHRDLKLDNILLDSKYSAKLTDFGFARQMYDSDSRVSQTYCGTLPYNCPCKVAGNPYDPLKSDVWSMGVILYILLHNRFPFHYDDTKEMLLEMLNHPDYIRSRFSSEMPREGRQLFEAMLNPFEKKRCSLKYVIANQWLKQLSKYKC